MPVSRTAARLAAIAVLALPLLTAPVASAAGAPEPLAGLLLPGSQEPPGNPRAAFPAGYTGYHTYREVIAELGLLVAAHPDLVAVSSYGTSSRGRPLPLVKISDQVGQDENEPEVLFTCGLHAREHLTVEMCLHIADRLAQHPGKVADREVWIMPMTNPDGAMYDITGTGFHHWRKNRQPNGDGTVGTDLNRNWGYRWGCCGGSSSAPGSPAYRGSAPFSAPETRALAEWVDSRVVGGEQQITAHIDWHSYSELVLWPYGYTRSDTAPGMTAAQAAIFRALGEAMAATNGYTAQQISDLYRTDGGINDWMWFEYGIWSFTIEMYPDSQRAGGFYPPDDVIDRETSRNDDAVDLLLRAADCVPCAHPVSG